jgi:hypothetical protein
MGIQRLEAEVTPEEWNAKARRGGPTGLKDQDPDAPGTAGILGLRVVGI